MSDAAARESRRRKILENSEKRLRMIGVANSAGETAEPELARSTVGTSLSTGEAPHYPDQSDAKTESTSHNYALDSSPIQTKTNCSEDAFKETFVPSERVHTAYTFKPVDGPPSLMSTILANRGHLVGLAVFVRLLFASNYSFLFAESIFVPLFSVTVVKHIGIIPDVSTMQGSSGMLTVALMLSGLPAWQVGFLKKVFGRLSDFFSDLYVYFFTFIVLHVFLECLIN